MKQPWTHADGGTWWMISGTSEGGWTVKGEPVPDSTIDCCIARVLPEFITGDHDHEHPAVFELLHGLETEFIPATSITEATPLAVIRHDHLEKLVSWSLAHHGMTSEARNAEVERVQYLAHRHGRGAT